MGACLADVLSFSGKGGSVAGVGSGYGDCSHVQRELDDGGAGRRQPANVRLGR